MNLLTKIRQALRHRSDVRWPEVDNTAFAIPKDMPLPDLFKRELEKVGGHAYLCRDKDDLIAQLKNLYSQKGWQKPVALDKEIQALLKQAGIGHFTSLSDMDGMDVGFGACEAAVAWTGSVVVSSALPGGRRFNIFSPELVIIARRDQLVLDVDQALVRIKEKYEQPPSQITVITGPSKTADIEKTLIYGMHGPKSLYVFIY